MARDGANIIAADINAKNAKETVDLIDKQETKNISIALDVSESASVKSALVKVLETYSKPPSIIVNCAGITRDNFLLNLSEENFQQVVDVNLKARNFFTLYYILSYYLLNCIPKKTQQMLVLYGCNRYFQ